MNSKAQKEVKKILDKLSSKFEGSKFSYEYNEYNETHIVEVKPLSLFNSEEYSNDEFDYILQFENKFKETLLFVSDESLTKVTKPIHIAEYEKEIESISLCGNSFQIIPSARYSYIFDDREVALVL